MDEAARCRRAARAAVRDIEPDRLRERMRAVLDEGSTVPGALALASARAVGGDPEPVAERAAGVQLIYDGLRTIRELARSDPWGPAVAVTPDGEGATVDPEADLDDADLSVLVADVLVSRGFYLLARTDAAGKAVETVRSFGRDQTVARSSDDEDAAELDANLEVDCLELAVIAGTTGAGGEPTEELLDAARRIAREAGAPLPPAATVLTDPDSGEDAEPLVSATDGDWPARPSATDS